MSSPSLPAPLPPTTVTPTPVPPPGLAALPAHAGGSPPPDTDLLLRVAAVSRPVAEVAQLVTLLAASQRVDPEQALRAAAVGRPVGEVVHLVELLSVAQRTSTSLPAGLPAGVESVDVTAAAEEPAPEPPDAATDVLRWTGALLTALVGAAYLALAFSGATTGFAPWGLFALGGVCVVLGALLVLSAAPAVRWPATLATALAATGTGVMLHHGLAGSAFTLAWIALAMGALACVALLAAAALPRVRLPM